MVQIVEQSMEQGCCGYSTGLEYAVERASTEDEIVALARATGRHGGYYATHTRARGVGALPCH